MFLFFDENENIGEHSRLCGISQLIFGGAGIFLMEEAKYCRKFRWMFRQNFVKISLSSKCHRTAAACTTFNQF